MTGEQGLHKRTPAELQAALAAERLGVPFLAFRRADGSAAIHQLDPGAAPVVVGRGASSVIRVDWDDEVSRVHALLEHVGEEWAIADDGLSSNGTFVNGERVHGRRLLRDGDVIRLGSRAGLVFRDPRAAVGDTTQKTPETGPGRISEAQRRVLVELCRPYRDGAAFAVPPGNAQIAQALVLSVDAVKTHMRTLYERFEVEDIPAQHKRARLVELAFRSGEITPRDLD